MKKTIFAVTAAAALAAAPALAKVKAPPPPPPAPVYSWTGCYVGVNGGVGWNNGNTHYNDPNTTPDPINFITAGIAFIPTPSGTGGIGGLGGGGAGCNWQSQQWVYGIEADIDGGRISGSQTNSVTNGTFGVGPGPVLAVGNGVASEQSQIDWLSTIRGRIGFAVQDRLLLFATGGLALARASTQGSVTVFNANAGGAPFTWSGSHSAVNAGFILGGGVEWAFADHLTAKAEYLWYDIGNISHPLNCIVADGLSTVCQPVFGFYTSLGNAVASFHGSIIRFGINYKFN